MRKINLFILVFVTLLTLTGCKKNKEPEHVHKYTDEIVNATCTEQGYTKHTCECGDSYQDSEVQAKGHTYGEWTVVKEATESEDGLQERICSCGEKEEEVIAKLGHIHKYESVVTEPTCTEKGYTTHTCECGHSYQDSEVNAKGHTYKSVVTKPTCTEAGYTTHTCECGDSYQDSEVKAKGHKYGAWIIVKYATEEEEGLRERECSCGEKEEEVIEKLEHVEKFEIEYVLNQELALWPTRPADNRTEIVSELYKDLYNWAKENGETCTYDVYVRDTKAKLSKGEDVKIYNANLGDEPATDGSIEYFLNIPRYYDKWNAFFKIFNKAMQKASSEDNFFTNMESAMLRLYQFSEWNSAGLSCFRSYVNELKNATIIEEPVPTTYVKGDSFYLPILSHEKGAEFLGWYDNPEFSGSPVVEITSEDEGDKVFYAMWNNIIKPEKIEVNKISELLLFSNHQLVCNVTPSDATDSSLSFVSSDPAIAMVTSKGLIVGLRNGKVIITVQVNGNRDLDVSFVLTVYTNDYIDAAYSENSYLVKGESTQLLAEVVRKNGTVSNVVWKSEDETIATVDENGYVTAHNGGLVTIVATDPDNAELTFEFVLTILDEMPTGILDLALRSHENKAFLRYDLNIGNTYKKDIHGSVTKILANSPLTKNTKYYDAANQSPATFGKMTSVEFVTVHYTGNMASGADANANANYFANAKDVSIHYTTGNDGVYYCLDESKAGWHAGDSGAMEVVGEFKWIPTGVMVGDDDPMYPIFTISTDFYYEINGHKTTVPMPKPWDYKDRHTDHILNEDGTLSSNPLYGDTFKGRLPEEFINDQSLPFVIVDGEYYMGTTWWAYTQVYEGRICSTGGNRNSVGIESCVNEGSDLWWTWQKTAQLVADIMYRHNLDITRVRGHHFFTAKDCPQPMLENDLEIWWEFLELVEAEYELLKKYQGYQVIMVSHNPDIVDNNGRVIKQPMNTTCVTYTITFTKGDDVQSITLATLVQGACVDR